MAKLAVIAIGGNSLIKDEKHKTVEDQYQAAKETTYHIADMIEQGWDVAIGHGNGPRSDSFCGAPRSPPKWKACMKSRWMSAALTTQGAIGYALQQNLQNELYQRGIKKKVVTIITQMLVDKDDPAFQKPSKPIGGFMDAERSETPPEAAGLVCCGGCRPRLEKSCGIPVAQGDR